MSSNLKVNTILPSAGTAIGIGTAGGTLSLTGSVGIGTSTHNGVFHIQHNVGNSTNYYLNDGNTVHIKNTHADGYASLRLMGGGTGSDNNAIVWGGQGSESLIFSNRQNERVRILADGKVRIAGVSTLTNMGQTLQLLDNDSTDAIGTKSTLGFLGYVNGVARTLAAVGTRKNSAGDDFAGDLSFFTRRDNQSLLDERVRITSAGSVGINSLSPAATLDIHDVGSTGPCLLLRGGSATEGDIVVPHDEALAFGHWNYSSSTFTERLRIDSNGDVYPGADNGQDLGTSSKRWANVYSADLQLSNKGKTNDVDGTWGDYTIQEGESDLFLINNRNGKKYKFNLTEVS